MYKKKKLPIIFLMGHTASGKTELSIKLKSIFPIDIISVDSISIYRDMNIGSAKPKNNILNKFKHELINIRDPAQKYSVFEFYNDSINLINKSHNQNKIPMFSGGTMFYFNILLNGISKNLYDINIIKNFIQNKLNKKNITNIFNKFNNMFPKFLKNVDKNNILKISKFISIFILQGNINYNIKNLDNIYNIYKFYILDKSNILKKIKYRLLNMLYLGFEEEVKNLYNRGDLNINMQSIKSIGYKQMWLYIDNKITYKTFFEKTIILTLHLVKKQIKWINKFNKNLIMLNKKKNKYILTKISKIFDNYI